MGFIGPALLTLLALGAAIGVALIGVTVAFVLYDPLLSVNALFRSFFSFVNKYTLMAIPFFVYAGFLMERTGLIKKLFRFADALIGWLPGGFAYATILAAVMFGAISGSSTAMAAAMGLVAYPEMIKRGYPKWMAAGVIATGGVYASGQTAFTYKDDLSYRAIPRDTPTADLRATHFAYDLTDARRDINVVFPIDTLRAMVADGDIGELAPDLFTCMGGIYSQRRVREELAPALVERCRRDEIEAVLLVPV